MIESDFSQCEFIDTNLRFVYFLDFFKNRNLIKLYYQALNSNGKRFYKWYVYANVFTTMKMKDIIWEFINSEDDETNAKCLFIMTEIKNKMK